MIIKFTNVRINSANILINKEGKVKIADFGVAYINNNFNQQQNNNNPTNKKSKFAKESTGSPYWSIFLNFLHNNINNIYIK